MSEHLVWRVGNRNPSITENLVDTTGAAIDLTDKTVKFKARDVGSSVLLVDQPATIVGAPTAGNVRYDWSVPDITAPDGILAAARSPLVWWEVTTTLGGRTQDYGEAQIVVEAHAPGLHAYVELEELKSSLELTGESFADEDLRPAILAASKVVEDRTHRRFWKDADATQVRYYSPDGKWVVAIDDALTVASVASDFDGDGTFEQTWVNNVDYTLEPLNASANSRPYEMLRRHPRSGFTFSSYPRSLKVTGMFGWAAVPWEVHEATKMIASRVAKRIREAPFGVVGGLEGEAVRISRYDSDVDALLCSVARKQVLA